MDGRGLQPSDHPSEEVRNVLEELTSAGWKLEASGHWGKLKCPCITMCRMMAVHGTPQDPARLARNLRRHAHGCESMPQQTPAAVTHGDNNVAISGVYGNVTITTAPVADKPEEDWRQKFRLEFLQQALKQASVTFRCSIIFMSAGAIILLTGGVIALFRNGSSVANYAALLTVMGGALISTCGGAFALHSNRARKHLTSQADQVRDELLTDHTLQQTLDLIDRLDDPTLRDHFRSLAAMRALGMAPQPDLVVDRVLPPRQITPPPPPV